MVIDEEGQQLGVLNTAEALSLAQEKGLDLVEVSPLAEPPVCRIIDYGKFQYQQNRRQHKAKKVETKGIRLSFKIGQHDLDIRKKQTEKFLSQGHSVKIELRLRGREKAFREKARAIITQFLANLAINHQLDKPIQQQGGSFSVTINKK
jgi:translation initiation factor IF-3